MLDSPNSGWSAHDVVVNTIGIGGKISRFFSIVFATWAILSFFYAELEWQTVRPKDGGIGMGTSTYVLVLYARPIALACISAALAIIAHGGFIVRKLRISHRSVLPSDGSNKRESAHAGDDSDLIGNRFLAKLRGE